MSGVFPDNPAHLIVLDRSAPLYGAGSTLIVPTSTVIGDPNDSDVSDYQSAEVIVGDRGTGQLDVSNGGYVGARELHVGLRAVTVDAYTGYTTDDSFGYLADVDAAGYGTVNITGAPGSGGAPSAQPGPTVTTSTCSSHARGVSGSRSR